MTETTLQLSASGLPLSKRWLGTIAVIWVGQAISIITSYMANFAAIWYVTETTGSALMLAVAGICAYLPIGLLSPIGGVLADKINRKTILIVADLSIGVVAFILGVIILLGQASLPLIFVLIAVCAAGQAFHNPAMMAAMPMLVPEKHLLRINTLDQLLVSLASIGAPVLGITLYVVLGFHSLMFLNFVGALCAVGALLLVKIPTVKDPSSENQHIVANLVDGWRAFSAHRGLLILLGGVTLGMIVFAPLGTLFPLMTYNFFSGDGYMASLVEAAFGFGMLAGSFVLIAWGGGKRLARLIALAAFLVGVFTAVCGLLAPSMFIGFVILCVLLAIPCAWFNGPLITLVQKNVASEKTGRALGFINAAIGVTSPIGIALGGGLAEVVGLSTFFIIDGAILILLGLALCIPKSVQALDKTSSENS
jgi:MFS transporter, DHA3 family, macrolide efflux protein